MNLRTKHPINVSIWIRRKKFLGTYDMKLKFEFGSPLFECDDGNSFPKLRNRTSRKSFSIYWRKKSDKGNGNFEKFDSHPIH
jgi:hypothetical protein